MAIRQDLAGLKKLKPADRKEKKMKQADITSYMVPVPQDDGDEEPHQQPSAPVCSICLEEVGFHTHINSCPHLFHEKCIIDNSKHADGVRPKCPMCRKEYWLVMFNDGTSTRTTTVGPAPEEQEGGRRVVRARRGSRRRLPAFFAEGAVPITGEPPLAPQEFGIIPQFDRALRSMLDELTFPSEGGPRSALVVRRIRPRSLRHQGTRRRRNIGRIVRDAGMPTLTQHECDLVVDWMMQNFRNDDDYDEGLIADKVLFVKTIRTTTGMSVREILSVMM